jgi:hypothetical protein
MAAPNFTESDQQEFLKLLEDMQIKDSQRMYNSLTERCFEGCVVNFRTRRLEAKEVKCVNTCIDSELCFVVAAHAAVVSFSCASLAVFRMNIVALRIAKRARACAFTTLL